MRVLRNSICLAVAFFLSQVGPSWAEMLRLDPLVRQTERAIPFCITDFKGSANGRVIASVIRKDLSKHGAFVKAGISDNDVRVLDDADREKGSIHFRNWANLGAQILGKGEVGSEGGLSVDFKLYTPYNGKRVIAKRYRAPASSARRLGHIIADDIVETLLHEKGFFSSRLLFVKGDHRSKNLCISDSDGTGVKALTRGNTLCIFPDWFPDRKSILFTSYYEGRPIIYRMALRGGTARRLLAMPGMNTSGAVSPDGRKLAAILDKDGHPELYVMDLPSGQRRRLTRGRAVESSPSWSPDSRRIVYSSDEAGGRPQIYIISANGSNPHRLTSTSFSRYCTSPMWSPDGKKIAFVAQLRGNFDICLYDVDSRQLYQLTTNPSNDEHPSWARDSRHIAFSRTHGSSSRIMLLDAETGKTTPMIQQGQYCGSPAWEP